MACFPYQKADQRAESDADHVDPDVGKLRTAAGQRLQAFVQKGSGEAEAEAFDDLIAQGQNEQCGKYRILKHMRQLAHGGMRQRFDPEKGCDRIQDLFPKPAAFLCGDALRQQRLYKDKEQYQRCRNQQNDSLGRQPPDAHTLSLRHASRPFPIRRTRRTP